ncbi:glutathione-dependent formaldehyde dehydrogenase [Archangium violaceum]|uniref:zinc-dependent alcohol dehydrogenase n=1 Tax=Archangium violaceum TaxID=83451 RepID=UPI0019509D2E|nr:zinc-dependent alcohol dehydrogenase [Archangium violaceum]QRN96012.1 glutathione-dependent formaldehyde dehydrogenase [Archangium violaceum]
MKAVCWTGVNDVRVETVPDPSLLNPRDAIVKVRATTICGSDLHLYDGYIPSVLKGDILGHEFMGEIVEVGSKVKNLKPGDRVIVPSVISCGDCSWCKKGQFSLCDNSNPKPALAEKLWGHATCGIFGYSHMMGGYAGSHAEYIRVPFADVGPRKVPDGLSDEQALFISDAFPTGFMGADLCNIQHGDTVAVWGCGAVGLFAMKSAWLLGAGRVIAIDRLPDRLAVARERCQAEVLDYTQVNVPEALKELTGGQGPDACIDAVGMEAHEIGYEGVYDRVKQAMRLETERPYVLREAIQACRKGGIVSIMGVYGALVDKFPMGAAMNKGLTLRMGQMHAQRYLDRLIGHVERGEVDPSFVATHRMALDDAPQAYDMFKKKKDHCLRVVLTA